MGIDKRNANIFVSFILYIDKAVVIVFLELSI